MGGSKGGGGGDNKYLEQAGKIAGDFYGDTAGLRGGVINQLSNFLGIPLQQAAPAQPAAPAVQPPAEGGYLTDPEGRPLNNYFSLPAPEQKQQAAKVAPGTAGGAEFSPLEFPSIGDYQFPEFQAPDPFQAPTLGRYDYTDSPVWGASKRAVESQARNSMDDIIAGMPTGGGMSMAMMETMRGRGDKLSDLASQIAQDEYNKRYSRALEDYGRGYDRSLEDYRNQYNRTAQQYQDDLGQSMDFWNKAYSAAMMSPQTSIAGLTNAGGNLAAAKAQQGAADSAMMGSLGTGLGLLFGGKLGGD